jgi:CHAD domain-containing protein
MALQEHLQRESRNFAELIQATAKDASRKNVHDLRVCCRRLQSDLWLIPKKNRTGSIRRAYRHLGNLVDTLGDQRRYDVAWQDAKAFGVQKKKIRERREKARDRVQKFLKGKKAKKYTKDLNKGIKKANQVAAAFMVPQLEKLRVRSQGMLENTPTRSADWHKLRIELKRVRYVLEAFHHEIPRLKSIQDHLGRWHDMRVLADLVGNKRVVKQAQKKEVGAAQRSLKGIREKTGNALAGVESELTHHSAS